MASEHGIMGDEDFGTSLPETTIDKEAMDNEARTAKFSRTQEYKKLKEYLEGRIEFYQHFLPGGQEVRGKIPTPEEWAVASSIIAEFNAVLATYENAKEAVDAQRKGA